MAVIAFSGEEGHVEKPALSARQDDHLRVPARSVALVLIAAAFFIAYWFSFPRTIGERPVFNSPRENVGYYLTERFLDGHNFSAPLRHSDELPRDIALALTPRDAANLDGNVVPKDFAGTMLLYAAVMFVHPSLALFLGPLFAILGAWALMRTADELFGAVAGFVAFVCWLAFPPLWINASFIFSSDMPALAFLLLALMFFVQYWDRPTTAHAGLAAGCFCASVVFRYPNVMLAVPFVAALLLTRRVVLAHAAIAVAAAIPFATIILAFNYFVYGDALTTGFHLGAELIAETANYSKESFLKRRPDVLWRYLRMYSLEPWVSGPVIVSLCATFAVAFRHRGARRAIAIIALSVFGILVAYYGQQDAWGYRSPQLPASVLRYLLPGFALITLFGAWAVAAGVSRWGAGLLLLPVGLVLAHASWLVIGPGGVNDIHDVTNRTRVLQQEILAATEPDDVIAVRVMDKVLYPDRQTLTLTYAMKNEEPFPKGRLETWDYVAPPERFADIAAQMYVRGISLYLLPDARVGGVAAYQVALLERGLYLRWIPEVGAGAFYKVSRVGAE